MKSTLALFLLLLLTIGGFAQRNLTPEQQTADDLRTIGVELYQMELASRIAADSLLANFPADNIAGYLSYRKGKGFKVIFWQPDTSGKMVVVHDYSFTPDLASNKIRSNHAKRSPSAYEKALISVRTDAARRANQDREIASAVGSMQMSLYLRDDGNRIYAYLCPVTTSASVVLLGLDFVLIYDRTGAFLYKQQMHPELIRLNPKTDNVLNPLSGKTFTSINGKLPYPTATDICTLLLFRNIIEWEEFCYNSDKYLSVMNVKTGQLSLIKK